MRITINPTFFWNDDQQKYVLVSHDGVYEHSGFMLRCCGGGAVGETDQALQAADAKTTATLSADAQTTFGESQNILAAQQAKYNYMISNPQGYDPQSLATATTSINQNAATAAKQAISSAAAFSAARGGSDFAGGGASELVGRAVSSATNAKAGALSQLAMQNQEMKRANVLTGLQGLNQVGAEYNNSNATSTTGGANFSNAAENAGSGALAAQQAEFNDISGVIKGVAGLATGGIGTAMDISNFENQPAPK
jgi:hypothetical protein